MRIEDGSGGGSWAKVNKDNRLDVSSSTFSEAHRVASINGETFTWTSSFSTATGEEIIYVKNTSKTQVLVIEKIALSSVLTGLFELFEVTGTATGTTITGSNTNLSSGVVAEATSLGNAAVGSLVIGKRLDLIRLPATGNGTLDIRDVIILGLNDAIAITYTGSTGITDSSIVGYYEGVGEV